MHTEVKESLKKNEQKIIPRFNAFLILSKDIESIVQSNTIAWNNIYALHKPTKEVVQIVDDKDDEEKEDIEKKNDEEINNVERDDTEDEEFQEATGGDLPKIQSIQDLDPEKIVADVMTSLPLSLSKELSPPSSEKDTAESIEVNTILPSTQLIVGATLPSAMMSVVTITSSTKKQAPIISATSQTNSQEGTTSIHTRVTARNWVAIPRKSSPQNCTSQKRVPDTFKIGHPFLKFRFGHPSRNFEYRVPNI